MQWRIARVVKIEDRIQQGPRVGMLGAIEDCPHVTVLDHPAGIHDEHMVGQRGHHGEVVGDEDHRAAELLLQVAQQLQDLRLNGDVERRRRLVGDQQVGLTRDRGGNQHALAHAAGKLMRIVVEAPLAVGNADELQELDRTPACRGLVEPLMDHQVLGDLLADGEHRVERGHGVLEDHSDPVPANLGHLLFGQREQVAVAEKHAPAADLPGWVDEPQDRERGHALAGAGLADDAEDLAGLDGEREAVHGFEQTGAQPEMSAQVLNL